MGKAKLIKTLKTTTLSLIICWIFSIILGIYNTKVYGSESFIITLKIFSLGSTVIVAAIDLFVIISYLITSKIDENEILENENYERDIPSEIPPAISSLLIDYIMDNEREYTATIASLIAKGYVGIQDNEQVRIFKWDKENLLDHEKIVFQALANEEQFNGEVFKQAVINDALNIGVLKKTQKKYTYLIPIITLLVIIELLKSNIGTSFFFLRLFLYGATVILFLIFIIVMLLFSMGKKPNTIKGNYVRTEYGKNQAIKLTGLKKFLHDYTLLRERGLEATILYDDYIAYAIALGEADAIENLILNNAKYRNLVYRKDKLDDDPIKRM